MPPYAPTHLPYGLTDPSKRTIRNPGFKDEATFHKYGIETAGDRFFVGTTVQGGGGDNGTKTFVLRKGETYTVKPGEWHRFFNPRLDETMLFGAKVAPAHQGFEKLLYIY
ncbi:hypothetical protein LTR85_001244 [Meristemomyces frigidus]|nr:hypothetical protein LTR85_001244 [Meristemomyces frigidus]